MTERVKPDTDPADGQRRTGSRAEQARQTRRRIVAEASALFLERGYSATMLDEVAARAGVAVQTVYFHFGNKRTLLKEAVDIASAGDDEPVPLLARPWLDVVRDEPDPRKVIQLVTAEGRRIVDRVAGIMRVVRDASGIEPDMAAQWATNEQQQLTFFTVFATMLAERNALRSDLNIEEARDIIFALSGLETYLLLSGTCGWSLDHWEERTNDLLARALLGR